MVQIKRQLSILLIVALLFFLSSCGKKESNNFQEVDFSKKTPVQIMYRQVLYNADIHYNGNKLEMELELSEGNSVGFSIDDNICTVIYGEMSKNYSYTTLSDDFLPLMIYEFFCSYGIVVKATTVDEQGGIYKIKSTVNNNFITFEISKGETDSAYLFTIS